MAIDLQVIVPALSALASVLSLASSTRNLMKYDNISAEEAIEVIKKQDEPKNRTALSDPSLVMTAMKLLVIHPDLLKQLSDELDACIKRHIQDSINASTHAEKSKADRNAEDCVCAALRRIVKFNDDKMPNDINLKNLWRSYGCSP